MLAEQREFHLEAVGQRVCRRVGCRSTDGCNPHHVIYQQELRRIGREDLLWDSRNCLRLCTACHADHHGIHSVSLVSLTAANYEFAFEVLGLRAYDYLRQKYDGEDPRLEDWRERTAGV